MAYLFSYAPPLSCLHLVGLVCIAPVSRSWFLRNGLGCASLSLGVAQTLTPGAAAIGGTTNPNGQISPNGEIVNTVTAPTGAEDSARGSNASM